MKEKNQILPMHAIFPSRAIYWRLCLAASVSRGSVSVSSSIENTSSCRNLALSSKFILASKQTTLKRNREKVSMYGSSNLERLIVWSVQPHKLKTLILSCLSSSFLFVSYISTDLACVFFRHKKSTNFYFYTTYTTS